MSDPVTLQNWDPGARRIDDEMDSADFITSESTLVLVTPRAVYDQQAVDEARPVALVQDVSFSQQPQVFQVHEVGSSHKYTLRSGRMQHQFNISRMFFDGDSLLKTLAPPLPDFSGLADRNKPGYAVDSKMFMNLQSRVFSRPIGVILAFKDLENQGVGAVFLEETLIASHTMNFSANTPMIAEGVSLLFSAIHPMTIDV